MNGGTASSGVNLLCTGTLKFRDAVGRPSQRDKSAGWAPVGRCGDSAFSSLAFYFIVSQSTVMAQDMELAHLFKNSYFCFLLEDYLEGFVCQSGLDVGIHV